MTQRLNKLMSEVILKEGAGGRARLASVIRRGEQMINRYMKGQSTPSPSVAYELAKACGATEEVALEIAKECSSKVAKESA